MIFFTKDTNEESIDSEKKIYKDLKKGKSEVFIKAYDLYVDKIYRFVYFKVGNKEDAQDISSQVFLKAWNYIQDDNQDKFKSLQSLLYTIARNTVIDHYRKNNNKMPDIEIDNQDLKIDLKDESQSAEKKLDMYFDLKIVESKLKLMKDEYREVIILKYVEQLSTAEIAKILNKSRGSIRVLSHRAMNALQDLIGEKEK